MAKTLVVANWKRYIEDPAVAKKFAAALRRRARSFSGVDVLLAPGYPLLPTVAAALKGSALGVAAQGLSAAQGAQHTGEVSAAMLRGAGATAVIVGHSERRAMGEGNDTVAAQLALAHGTGLTTILCVGEVERDQAGLYVNTVAEQLRSALANLRGSKLKLVVAYEPVWAIGKSAQDAMQPAEVTEMVIFIKKTLADVLERGLALRVPILYGGSVEPTNAGALIKETGINGFLVGHASADIDSFTTILTACK